MQKHFKTKNTVKPDLTTTCEQRPVWVVNDQSKSQFYQTPLSNGRFFQVPRVAVVHRLDCMLLRNIWDLFNLGQLDPIVRMYFACPKTIFMWEFLSRISFDSILCKCRLPRNSSMINRSVQRQVRTSSFLPMAEDGAQDRRQLNFTSFLISRTFVSWRHFFHKMIFFFLFEKKLLHF